MEFFLWNGGERCTGSFGPALCLRTLFHLPSAVFHRLCHLVVRFQTAVVKSSQSFKQQLKAVIVKVLSGHKINIKDPLLQTCANKLSVICMALLKDSKNSASSRQMYQVAKSHAKQVVQFIKQ